MLRVQVLNQESELLCTLALGMMCGNVWGILAVTTGEEVAQGMMVKFSQGPGKPCTTQAPGPWCRSQQGGDTWDRDYQALSGYLKMCPHIERHTEQKTWTEMNSDLTGLECCEVQHEEQQLETGVSEANVLICPWMLARRILCIWAPETCNSTKPGSSWAPRVYVCMPHVCISASNDVKWQVRRILTDIHCYKYRWFAWHPRTPWSALFKKLILDNKCNGKASTFQFVKKYRERKQNGSKKERVRRNIATVSLPLKSLLIQVWAHPLELS